MEFKKLLESIDSIEVNESMTSKDAINKLSNLRSLAKQAEMSGEWPSGFANKLVNDLYDIILFVETPKTESLETDETVEESENDFVKIPIGKKMELFKKLDAIGAKWNRSVAVTPDGEIAAHEHVIDSDGDRYYFDYYVKKGLMDETVEEDSIEENSVEEDLIEENSVEETVSMPVTELADILKLAGFNNIEEKINEYANSPEPHEKDVEEIVAQGDDLNRAKGQYPAAEDGDNPMVAFESQMEALISDMIAEESDESEESVEEGIFGLSTKEKGRVQDITSEISDIPGNWDFKTQTFTDSGLEQLKDALKNNSKYIKYALKLTAKDYEAIDEENTSILDIKKLSGM